MIRDATALVSAVIILALVLAMLGAQYGLIP